MTREQLIAIYADGFDKVKAVLAKIPKEAYDYKPTPQAWSIREIIHHLPDSEASAYVRCRKIIAQSGVTVDVYDQELWAERLGYGSREVGDALELFRLMRSYTVDLLRTVDAGVWENHFVMHPENSRVTLLRWLELYARHADSHSAQMQRNYEAWGQEGRRQ